MMDATLDFTAPWALLLLPLALWPLLPRRDDTLAFSWAGWLPEDRIGRALGIMVRACAALSLASIVVGLAGPGLTGLAVHRTGRGAQMLILMDRSGSMTDVMASRGVNSSGESKNSVARSALVEFVRARPNDRFAFMMFGISPVLAMPFTYDHAIIADAIDGTRIGRGMPDTQLGRGLLAAIAQFDARPFTGHRAIVMVSDGGALLTSEESHAIADGLARNRIALYFVFLRSSVYTPALDVAVRRGDASPEARLHRFFLSLRTPYRLFEAGDANGMAAAMRTIGEQQNYPVAFVERLPRQDRSAWCFAVAIACCAMLIVARAIGVGGWQ